MGLYTPGMGVTTPLLFCSVTILSITTRFFQIDQPPYICWDETHFGKMAGLYINQTFFSEVHPPLGKMMIAAIGLLCGYDGKFAFTRPGDSYSSEDNNIFVPYIGMRVACAIFGSLVIPIVFSIVHTLTESATAALVSSIMLICDVSLVTLSRFILLDPLMLFFMFAAILGSIKLSACHQHYVIIRTNIRNQSSYFSWCWWMWLCFTGICLGCALSIKLVSTFTVLFIGIKTIHELWELLGDVKNVSLSLFLKHLAARSFGLIILPILVYIGIFYLHFQILQHSSADCIFYSSAFQSSLKGNVLHNISMQEYVTSSSLVTIRSNKMNRMFLHSHQFNFPYQVKGSAFQQITGYIQRDDNNWWRMELKTAQNSKGFNKMVLQHGNVVFLNHLVTNKPLNVVMKNNNHWHAAPMTAWHVMVAGVSRNVSKVYGSDLWKIEKEGPAHDPLHLCTFNCLFKLVNVAAECCLHSTDKVLPKWGKEQHEVSCSRGSKYESGCLWHVEEIISADSALPLKEIPNPSFLSKLFESHKVMFHLNAKLVKTPGVRISKPWHWLLNYKPQLFSKPEDKIYLTGTPLVWWMNLVSLPMFVVIFLSVNIIERRACRVQNTKLCKDEHQRPSKPTNEFEHQEEIYKNILITCKAGVWFLLGWCLHYFPFFAMSRVLFFHHYIPSHIFACMLTGTLVALLSKNIAEYFGVFFLNVAFLHQSTIAFVIAAIFHSFYLHCHFCYGMNY